MRCIIAFVVCSLLPFCVPRYVDRSQICLKKGIGEIYRSAQVMISFSASPYPLVSNDTNITLACTGRSVHPDDVGPGDKSYMTDVEFYTERKTFHACRKQYFEQFRTLSCNITVSGVTNDNFIWCIVRASNAPCNVGEIWFQVGSNVAPTVSRFTPTFIYDAGRMEVTCIGAGIPEPKVTWLLNGSLFNSDIRDTQIYATVNTTVANDPNATNTYRTISTVVTSGRTFPLSFQCVVENTLGKVYSDKVYVLHLKVTVLKLNTATIRWYGYPHMNFSLHSQYNLSLKCGDGCFETTQQYNISTATFSHLSMRRTYRVKVEALSQTGELIFAAAEFYSPDILPKPKRMSLKKITSQKAVVGWEPIRANSSLYGVFLGYNIVVVGENKTMNITLANNKSDIVLTNLVRKSEYTIRMRGFSQFGDGRILEYNFTTLDIIPAPENVRVKSVMGNSALVEWTVLEQQPHSYDKITAYKVSVRNETRRHVIDIKTSSDASSVSLNFLSPDKRYDVSVVALSDETQGMSSEWISFKTIDEKADLKKQQSSTNSNAVVIPVAIMAGVFIVIVVLIVIRIRRRKAKRRETIIPNQMVVDAGTRNFNDNLRILYPEYYNTDGTDSLEDLSSWEISRSRLAVMDNVLGGGHFGFVKEGVLLRESSSPDDGEEKIPVAVKSLKTNRGQHDWNELLREFDVLKHINSTGHRNIIKLIGGCIREVPLLLVMEFCAGGNLKQLLSNSKVSDEYKNIYSKFTERQLINISAEIARGMKFLFENKVVHRDIASRNILLNDQLVPKIADFGLARIIDVTAHYIVNKNRMLPVKWMSMESLAEGLFTAASDIWSYGILLWEICTLAEEPYIDVSAYDMLDYLQEGNRMSRPEHCSIEIFSIMEDCWQENPEERPRFDYIYNSLEDMLTNNERAYINLRPYHDVNETMLSKSLNLFPGGEISEQREDEESHSHDSGVHDTYL